MHFWISEGCRAISDKVNFGLLQFEQSECFVAVIMAKAIAILRASRSPQWRSQLRNAEGWQAGNGMQEQYDAPVVVESFISVAPAQSIKRFSLFNLLSPTSTI